MRLPKTAIHSSVLSYGTGAIANYTTPGGAEVLLPNVSVIQRQAAQAFASVRHDLTGPVVQVENGAPTSQPLATYLTGVLNGMGVSTRQAETAPRTDHGANHVYLNSAVTREAPPLAYVLSEMLNCKIASKAFAGSAATIVVILGSSFPNVQP